MNLMKSAVGAAIIAFLFSMVSWMVLPWHNATMKGFQEEDSVRGVLKDYITEGDGVYVVPNPDPPSENLTKEEQTAHFEAAMEKMREGPFVFMVARPDGKEPAMGVSMGVSFVLKFILAVFLALLLRMTRPMAFWKKAFLIAEVATVGAVLVHVENWNWWHFPTDYTVVGIVDVFVTWLLAGLWIAKCDAPKEPVRV